MIKELFKALKYELKDLNGRQWIAAILAIPIFIGTILLYLSRIVLYPYFVLINWVASGDFLSFSYYWKYQHWMI